MAITGTFEADFSKVTTGAQQAAAEVEKFGGRSDAADGALQRLVGTSIALQSKLVLAEAGARAAGSAQAALADHLAWAGTASEAQLAQLTNLTAEYLAMKGAVGSAKDAIAGMAAEQGRTEETTTTLHGALGKFDGILASLGIHVAPEIRALGELGEAAGQSASQLGLIATAGLVVSAAIGGWKVGRAIAEFFDLDVAIGNATAKLLGWGDVAAQVAGAKADSLALASKRAGREITDLTEALKINIDWLTTWNASAARATAPAESAKAIAKWHGEIAALQDAGVLQALTADLASNNFSLADLGKRYVVSVDALQLFARETKATSAAQTAAAEEMRKQSKATADALAADQRAFHTVMDEIEKTTFKLAQDHQKQWREDIEKTKDARNKATAEGVATTAKAEAELADLIHKTTLDRASYQILKAWETADAQVAAFKAGGDRSEAEIARFSAAVFDKATIASQAVRDTADAAAAATEQAAARSLAATATIAMGWYAVVDAEFAAMVAANAATAAAGMDSSTGSRVSLPGSLERGPGINQGARGPGINGGGALVGGSMNMIAPLQSFAAGGSGDFGSGTPVMLHGREAIIPLDGGGSGGGTTIHNTFNIVDTEANIARRVSEHLMRSLLTGRTLSA